MSSQARRIFMVAAVAILSIILLGLTALHYRSEATRERERADWWRNNATCEMRFDVNAKMRRAVQKYGEQEGAFDDSPELLEFCRKYGATPDWP